MRYRPGKGGMGQAKRNLIELHTVACRGSLARRLQVQGPMSLRESARAHAMAAGAMVAGACATSSAGGITTHAQGGEQCARNGGENRRAERLLVLVCSGYSCVIANANSSLLKPTSKAPVCAHTVAQV